MIWDVTCNITMITPLHSIPLSHDSHDTQLTWQTSWCCPFDLADCLLISRITLHQSHSIARLAMQKLFVSQNFRCHINVCYTMWHCQCMNVANGTGLQNAARTLDLQGFNEVVGQLLVHEGEHVVEGGLAGRQDTRPKWQGRMDTNWTQDAIFTQPSQVVAGSFALHLKACTLDHHLWSFVQRGPLAETALGL